MKKPATCIINVLPTKFLVTIFEYLSTKDPFRLEQVSHQYRQIIRSVKWCHIIYKSNNLRVIEHIFKNHHFVGYDFYFFAMTNDHL